MNEQASTMPQVALVTGASRGIGSAIATHLKSVGMVVYGTATSAAGADSISAALGAGRGLVLRVDDAASIADALAAIAHNGDAVSVLVNNAGITRDQLLLRQREEDWQQVIDTNLTGAARLTRLLLKGMVKQRYGRLIHISSVVASMGNAGQSNYAAAKAGLEGFSRAVALEVASRSITSNVVAPGFIETDMTAQLSAEQQERLSASIPAGRLGTVDDIASCVGFLASAKASYITGQTIHVNGGMYLT